MVVIPGAKAGKGAGEDTEKESKTEKMRRWRSQLEQDDDVEDNHDITNVPPDHKVSKWDCRQ